MPSAVVTRQPRSLYVSQAISRASIHGSQRVCFFSSSSALQKERLVILGSGWGGYEVLRGVDKKRWDVTMISASSYFNFTPLLASCAVGTLEFRCAVEPVRRYANQATTYQAWCDKIDFDRKLLTCVPATPLPSRYERPQTMSVPSVVGVGLGSPGAVTSSLDPRELRTGHTHPVHSAITEQAPGSDPLAHRPDSGDLPLPEANNVDIPEAAKKGQRPEFKINYDKLVIAVGCYSQTFNVPGVKEYAYFLKDVRDARAIRLRILECFEEASQPLLTDVQRRNLLNFCIVGAGPTGVEFAAELHDLIASDVRRNYGIHLARLARITLYDVASRVLGGFEKGLAEYAEQKFARNGINIKLKHHVEKVEDGVLHVREQGEVPFGLLVWSTGLAPNPLIESVTEVEKDKKSGSLLTDEYLHIIRRDGVVDKNVWAIGDAAVIKDGLLPATAQVAQQKAKYATRVINRLAKEKNTPEAFHFRNQGSLAYLGDWKALYDRTTVESGPKGKEAGRIAWLLWRSAYFTRTVSIRNKITVPYYWFLNWIFGRDMTRF